MRSSDSSCSWWTLRQVTNIAKAAIGTLTTKIQRQSSASVSAPPSSGPTALPMPATPRISPPASPAFDSGSAANVMPRIAGHISAPPIPIPTRAPIRTPRSGDAAPSAEKAANRIEPMKKIRRRPNMSARRPPETIAMPKTRA